LKLSAQVNSQASFGLLYFPSTNFLGIKNLMKSRSVRKSRSAPWLALALLLVIAPLVLGQKAAPAPSQTPAPASKDVHARVTEISVDSSITDDPAVDKMLAAYSPKVRELDSILGTLKGELRKGGIGAGSLGNFVSDGMRAQASVKIGKHVDLAVMNGGGLRRATIGEGELRARDIFELLPFENALVALELNGEQLLKLLGVVVSGHEAQSGAQITYIVKADKSWQLEAARMADDKAIDPRATYTVVTIDYLVNVGGERYGVLREGQNTRPLGLTLRDAVMAYVKSETAAGREVKPRLDGRFNLDRVNSVLTGESPNP
jgi:2',3'-cyclic-nucleotide 2'-phosphodiesterase (5'-nucleotidase family)